LLKHPKPGLNCSYLFGKLGFNSQIDFDYLYFHHSCGLYCYCDYVWVTNLHYALIVSGTVAEVLHCLAGSFGFRELVVEDSQLNGCVVALLIFWVAVEAWFSTFFHSRTLFDFQITC
jgi:hypothetical protein